MVEMALLLPVLMLLFLGSWTAANLIDDNNAAGAGNARGRPPWRRARQWIDAGT